MLKIFICFIILSSTIMTISGCKKDESLTISDSFNEPYEMLVNEANQFLEDIDFSGSVLLAKGDQIIISRGYGYADYENKILNQSDTQFNIASITKTLTSYAIMLMIQDGLIDENDTIDKFMADYPNGEEITIHHLLTHTSGIYDLLNLFGVNQMMYEEVTLEENIKRFINEVPFFSPGERFRYGNSAFLVLAAIIEQVSGHTYDEYLKDAILDPLNMESTGLNIQNESLPRLAKPYERVANGLRLIDKNIHPSFSHAAGGIHSTVEDMYKWIYAINHNIQLSEEITHKMLSPKINDFGYGWFLNNQEYFHPGSLGGYQSYVHSDLESKTTIIILSNNGISGAMPGLRLKSMLDELEDN